ncbi:TlpA family protein disulfide reductase [Haliangium ochraceum]|uniref:Redoxin domain protein n=1 Tax=Haliangium ochraceum (strain DSM 14365 / JCM 11303 / SMP-2) TaxID=502025 RepID=D0LUY0_HALO1|nr:TlpA disulfide reductase family protein [Haliangium ochraceum]ACY14020.1 Redoxin domain protein [Haliangium ochraceum DSM 14365]
MTRALRWACALIAVQAALIGAYWLVEQRRAPARDAGAEVGSDVGAEAVLGTQAPQTVDIAMPRLVVRARDGGRAPLPTPTRPTLVHVWATWCPPCRAELPGLLALPAAYPVDVVAIALDEDWRDVATFINGLSDNQVVLGDTVEVMSELGVHALPATFLVEPGGRMALRFDGARDWSDAAFLRSWMPEGPSED